MTYTEFVLPNSWTICSCCWSLQISTLLPCRCCPSIFWIGLTRLGVQTLPHLPGLHFGVFWHSSDYEVSLSQTLCCGLPWPLALLSGLCLRGLSCLCRSFLNDWLTVKTFLVPVSNRNLWCYWVASPWLVFAWRDCLSCLIALTCLGFCCLSLTLQYETADLPILE